MEDITALETVPHELLLQREPDKEIENATIAAKALKKVIDGRDDKVVIRGKTFLRYEDWQTVGQFYGYSVQTDEAAPVEIDGIKGAKAKAILLDRAGNLAGGAEAYCMRDEEKWATSPWFQLASMAQTRAGAKALRNRLAWVAVLAGYSGTPAEEMDGLPHGNGYEAKQDVPSCPDCGSQMWDNRATKKGRQPDFKCKDRSCNKAVWLDSVKTDEALRGELFGQAQKLLAHKDVSIRTPALDRLLKMSTEDMSRAVAELAENMRAKTDDPAEQERLAKIKTIETNVPAKEVERELRESHPGKTLNDLTLDELIAFQDNCVPF